MKTIDHNRIGAMRVTLGLAMRARLAEPDITSLRLAVIAVDKTFSADDPLRVALHDFADQFPCSRRNPTVLMDAGTKLYDAVRRASGPQPDARCDIGG